MTQGVLQTYREFLPITPSTPMITLGEGKKRHIRGMLSGVGARVIRLVRVAIGPLELGSLPAGQWRELTATELTALRSASGT